MVVTLYRAGHRTTLATAWSIWSVWVWACVKLAWPSLPLWEVLACGVGEHSCIHRCVCVCYVDHAKDDLLPQRTAAHRVKLQIKFKMKVNRSGFISAGGKKQRSCVSWYFLYPALHLFTLQVQCALEDYFHPTSWQDNRVHSKWTVQIMVVPVIWLLCFRHCSHLPSHFHSVTC